MTAESSVLNGRYRLDRKIGQGGFARVFLATDLLLKRRVAVKTLHAEATGEQDFLARFEGEAQAVAALDHPNILGIYDYGRVAATAYLVMPYVEGGSLHDRLRAEGRLSLQQVGEYLRQVAAALGYAHRRGIIHRDIKPQNMLLRAEDDRLLLADFGIAKVLSSTSDQSLTGIMGTPSYMAPEQFQGNVGRATDIYALGCVLFQLLTGELPYTGSTEQVMYGHLMAPIPSIVERGRGQLPPALQGVIERALAKRPDERFPTVGELARTFELAVAGAVSPVGASPPAPVAPPLPPSDSGASDFTRRVEPHAPGAPLDRSRAPGEPPGMINPGPQSAQWMASQPTQQVPVLVERTDSRGHATIGPPTTPRPAGRGARKRGALLGGIGAALAVLAIAGTVAGAVVADRRQGPPASTPAPTVVALATSTAATATEPATVPTGTTEPTAAPTAIAQADVAPTPAVQPSPTPVVATPTAAMPTATASPTAPPTATAQPIGVPSTPPRPTPPPTATATPTTAPSPTPSAAVAASPLRGQSFALLSGHSDRVLSVAWSPDGKTLASASADKTVRLWGPDGQLLSTLLGHTDIVISVGWSPDGKTLASGSADKTVRLWTAAGQPLTTLVGHTGSVLSVAWSPDGRTLASSGGKLDAASPDDYTIRLWTLDGKEPAVFSGHTESVLSVAWSPDGKILASGSVDKMVRLWTPNGELLAALSGHSDRVSSVAWSPDGKVLASASHDRTVRRWTPDGKALGTPLSGHTGIVTSLAWSPDGKALASGSYDRTVRLWTADGKPLMTLSGQTDQVRGMAWSRNGGILAAAFTDSTVRLWR